MDKKQKKVMIILAVCAALTLVAITLLGIFMPGYFRDRGLSKNSVKTNMMYTIVPFVIALLIMASAILILWRKGSRKDIESKYFSSRNMTRLAVFTALSYALYMFVKVPLPFIFPSFLDLQVSDVPALIAGFMMGPVAGAIVIALKIVLKLPFSTTYCVGELADLIIGLAFVLTASLIYRKIRTKKGAIISLAIGSLLCVITAMLINRFMLIPFYVKLLFEGNWDTLLNSVVALYPKITRDTFYNYYIWAAVLPFNILRCFLTALVTFFIYKRMERMFAEMFSTLPKEPAKETIEEKVSVTTTLD